MKCGKVKSEKLDWIADNPFHAKRFGFYVGRKCRASSMLGANKRLSAAYLLMEKHWDGVAAYSKPENKVSLGFVEGLNNKIRVIQRRAYGLRDEEYLRLKILTRMLKEI